MRSCFTFIFLAFYLLLYCGAAQAESPDTAKRLAWTPFAVNTSVGSGHVFVPKSVKKYDVTFPAYQCFSLSLLFTADKNSRIDSLYGRPYFGVGIYKPYLHKPSFLGNPISFYLLYGLTVYRFNPSLTLNFEAKLGGSFGWIPYDSTANPQNRIIGAKNNYHASADFFLKYRITPNLRVGLGSSFTHFSDGAYKLPNSGLNTLGGFAFLSYVFQERPNGIKDTKAKGRHQPPHWEFDFNVNYSSRQILGEVENSPTTVILRHSFKAIDLNTYAMFVKNSYVRAGAGMHFIYDESSNISTIVIPNDETPHYSYTYKLAKLRDRFSAGVFGKVELPMGYINGVAEFGYIFSNGSSNGNATRINLGLKSYVYRGANATFGIQIDPKRRTNCVFMGVGYTFGYRSLLR